MRPWEHFQHCKETNKNIFLSTTSLMIYIIYKIYKCIFYAQNHFLISFIIKLKFLMSELLSTIFVLRLQRVASIILTALIKMFSPISFYLNFFCNIFLLYVDNRSLSICRFAESFLQHVFIRSSACSTFSRIYFVLFTMFKIIFMIVMLSTSRTVKSAYQRSVRFLPHILNYTYSISALLITC